MQKGDDDVLITACAVASPLGSRWSTFVDSLRSGRSGVVEIAEERVSSGFPVRYGGVITDIDLPNPQQFKVDLEFKTLTKHLLRSLIEPDSPRLKFDGLVIGNNQQSFDWNRTVQWYRGDRLERERLVNPQGEISENVSALLASSGHHPPLPSARVNVFNTCLSGLTSIGIAFQKIKQGRWNRALVGSLEGVFREASLYPYLGLRVLTTASRPPAEASRPFSRDRSGFVKAEGGAFFVIETRSSAKERGVSPLVRVRGWSQTSDGFRITDGREDCLGSIEAMELALEHASLRPSEIEYINAHGSSTVLNDRLEARAMTSVFGDVLTRIPISSLKSQMGHANTGCGAIETAACIAMLQNQFVAPTLNLTDPEPNFDFIPNVSRARSFQYLIKNSFGFGGGNASLVLEKE